MKNIKNINNIVLLILLILGIIFAMSLNLYASSFETFLNLDEELNTDNEFVLVLEINNIKFENELSTIEGNIEYDTEIFSDVTIENLNGWSITFNKQNGKFIGFKISDEETKDEEICKIYFELDSNATTTDTTISLTNMKSADGDSLVATSDKNINIKIDNYKVDSAEEQSANIEEESILKYVLISIELILLITIITTIRYIVTKKKLTKNFKRL